MDDKRKETSTLYYFLVLLLALFKAMQTLEEFDHCRVSLNRPVLSQFLQVVL